MDKIQKQGLQSANLEVTQKCDSKCVSCNIWQMAKSPLSNNEAAQQERELDFDEHIQIINELKELGVKALQLHGGEPLLNTRLPEIEASSGGSGSPETVPIQVNDAKSKSNAPTERNIFGIPRWAASVRNQRRSPADRCRSRRRRGVRDTIVVDNGD